MPKLKFVLDSNVVIDFAKGILGTGPAIKLPMNGKLYISVITRIEALASPSIAPDEESRIRALLKVLKVVPLNRKVENNALLIRQKAKRTLPDAIIAASAATIGATTISRDGHFLKLNWPGLPVISPI
jgi:predicted nucleic acid-binding protein